MHQPYLAALIQLNTTPNLDENLAQIEAYVKQAAQAGARLVSLPEVCNVIEDAARPAYAEDENGKTLQLFRRLSKEHQLYLHGGSITQTIPDGSRAFNTSFFLDPQGEVLLEYQKIHTFDIITPDGHSFCESKRIAPGHHIRTIDTPLGCFGFAICYDIRFPELFRLLTMKGAQIIFNPANFNLLTGKDHWEPLLRARAIENSCYLLAAGQQGKNARMDSFGNSMVVDPWGTVVARAQDTAGVTLAQIDLDYLAAVRARMQTIENRREDVYLLKERADEV